jgi:hypothetical protein
MEGIIHMGILELQCRTDISGYQFIGRSSFIAFNQEQLGDLLCYTGGFILQFHSAFDGTGVHFKE